METGRCKSNRPPSRRPSAAYSSPSAPTSAHTHAMSDYSSSAESVSRQSAAGSSDGSTISQQTALQKITEMQQTLCRRMEEGATTMSDDDVDDMIMMVLCCGLITLYYNEVVRRAELARVEREEAERKQDLYQRMKVRQEGRIRCADKGCDVVKTRTKQEHTHKLDRVLVGRVRVKRAKAIPPRQAVKKWMEGVKPGTPPSASPR